MVSRWRRWLGPSLACAVTTCVVGCDNDPDIPTGPDMAPLASIYDNPPGTLDEQNVQMVAQLAAVELAKVAELGDLDFVVQTLQNVANTVENFSEERGDEDTGGQVPVDGVGRFTTICPGWVPGGRLDREANGTLNLTLPFRDGIYLPVIFGSFVECQFRAAGGDGDPTKVRVQLNSAVSGYIGPGIRLDLSNLQSVLFQLQGVGLFGGGEPFDVELDFRVYLAGRLETRVSAIGGDVIPFVEQGNSRVGIRAANGTFCCDFEERLCIQTETSSCEGVMSGDRVLTW